MELWPLLYKLCVNEFILKEQNICWKCDMTLKLLTYMERGFRSFHTINAYRVCRSNWIFAYLNSYVCISLACTVVLAQPVFQQKNLSIDCHLLISLSLLGPRRSWKVLISSFLPFVTRLTVMSQYESHVW